MDRKMLRFVEKRGVRTDKTKRLQRGQKCCQRLDLRFHYLSKCAVSCLDKSEQRWVPTDKTPLARTEVLSARGEESKPVAHPCRGPGGQAGDHQQRRGHPLSGAREPWLAPNVIGARGVTTLSANLAGDDSWVAGIELATASEPPAQKPRIWGVALRASTPATPELEPAFEPCPIPSRKADSKPLPDNNSKHKPPKFVIGVAWHPRPPGHWSPAPSSTTPGPAGSGRAQTFPRWLLPSTDRGLTEIEQGPISTIGLPYYSVCHRTGRPLRANQTFLGSRQLVRQDGWQAAIFGGRNRPGLLMVAHQLASTCEVTSW